MIRKIVLAQDPNLRKPSKPVTKIDKKTLDLAKDLYDTLIAQKDPEGVGLAAPQIGVNFNMFAMEDGSDIKIITNPQILNVSKSIKKFDKKDPVMEGCLSVPHYYGPLERAESVEIKYLDLTDGTEKIAKFKDFPAQIVQHEIDHLGGVLFIDHILEQKKSLYKLVGDEWEKVDLIF